MYKNIGDKKPQSFIEVEIMGLPELTNKGYV